MSNEVTGLTTSEKRVLLKQLEKARYTGARRVKFRDYDTEYKSDEEMANAIAALKQDIAASSGNKPTRTIRTSFSSGL